ncbi:MAG: DUF177 domain-containing protein [Pseudomonadota bacterium]
MTSHSVPSQADGEADADDVATPLAAWSEEAEAVAARTTPLDKKLIADETARAQITRAAGLIGCDMVEAAYTLTPRPGGRVTMQARFEARVRQTCVVTLEPIEQVVAEAFTTEFRPAEAMPAPANGETAYDEAELDLEPIEAGVLQTGRVIYEHLVAGLDPYPRASDAALDASEAHPPAADPDAVNGKPNPFAALARLKPSDG